MSADGSVRVSVILAVRNGEPFLRKQLEALERQRCSFPWEVIVVDNGSTDASARTAREFETRLPSFQLLHEQTPGKSRALNLGMAAARGSQYVFVDSDDEADGEYVQKMSEALDEFDAVGGFIETTTLNPPCARVEMVTNDEVPIYHDFRPGLPGCVTGMRAATCERVGPYDETLLVGEDVDYTWRAFASGASFGRQPAAVMHIRRPANSRAAFRKSRSYAHAAVWMYERYRSKGLQRRSLRKVLGPLRWTLVDAWRDGGPTQPWRVSWQIGTILGRAEESIRRRVLFP
jgi:glycosyltransferase involved in cell wall biosynthesis